MGAILLPKPVELVALGAYLNMPAKNINQILDDSKKEFEQWWDAFSKTGKDFQRLYYLHDFEWVESQLDLSLSPLIIEQEEIISLLNKESNKLYKDSISYNVIYYSCQAFVVIKNGLKFAKKPSVLAFVQDYILWRALCEIFDKIAINTQIIEVAKSNFLYNYFKSHYEETPSVFDFPDGYFEVYDERRIFNSKTGINLYANNDYSDKIYYICGKSVEETESNSLTELQQILELLGEGQTKHTLNPHRYRGQANAAWTLDSSLTRNKEFEKNERNMYYDVRNAVPNSFATDQSLFQELIRLQHYNFPTRLLDLTRNPLVAIYFACCNSQAKNKDGVIFRFSQVEDSVLNFDDKFIECLAKRTKCRYNQEDDCCELPCKKCSEENACEYKDTYFERNWMINGYLANPRIDNQQGDFIFINNNSSADIYKFVNRIIIIEAKLKSKLLENLASLNIHAGTLFPELSTINSFLKEKYDPQHD